MLQKFLKTFIAVLIFVGTTTNICAQNANVVETPDKIRFEQYVGTVGGGQIYFWRLPAPGVKVDPIVKTIFQSI